MNTFTFTFILILGIILGLTISLLQFFDFVGLLVKIFPCNAPSDYEEYKKFINSDFYRNHKSKWIKILSITSVVYIIVYCVVAFSFDDVLLGFYSAIIASAIYFGIASNVERKQRKKTREIFKRKIKK